MCRDLIYLVTLVLVSSMVGNASADLVAHWRFNNDATDLIGALHWTLENGAGYSTDSKEGSHSLRLDGTDDYVSQDARGVLTDPFNTRTVSMWFKADTTSGTQVLYDEGGYTTGLSIRIKDGDLESAIRSAGVYFVASTGFSNSGWTHVAVSFDFGQLRLYLNGAAQDSVMASFNMVGTHGNVSGIGARNDEDSFGNNSTGDYFGGLIDDVQIYDNALSVAEIQNELANAHGPVPFDGALHGDTWVTLSWSPGHYAVSHDVYFGDNLDDVHAGACGTFRGSQTSNDFLVGLPGSPYPEGLSANTTYYWRIDEVEADRVTKHKGRVWSFFVSSGTIATAVVIPKDGDWASSINALEPGDIGQLEAGRYLGGKTITVSGTPDKPIIIHGAGYLESIFDGESGNCALRLDNCSNLIIENITVTNPSPIGIDGRENYSSLARNRLPERDPGYSTLAEGIIIRGGGSRITIRRSYFVDIATRGILVGTGGVDDLTVEHNIFIRVSDDTAGGDVAAGSSATRMTVRENLMAGNVDGIVTHGVGAGHIFERNVIIFHR